MDDDFHYYGTYAAAKLAGWDDDDAMKFADYSILTDYFDYHIFGYPVHFTGHGKDYRCRPIFTSQYASGETTEYGDGEDEGVWLSFHFLPGNYLPLGWVKDDRHLLRKPEATDLDTKLICRPFSALSKMIMDDTWNEGGGDQTGKSEFVRCLIGIRLHVFADTWAHQDFSGQNKSVNSYVNKATAIEVYTNQFNPTLNCSTLAPLTWDWAYNKSDLSKAPTNFALGHAQMGHLPDFGFLKYWHQIGWAGQGHLVYRDNPAEYHTAFEEMTRWLRALKLRRAYNDITIQWTQDGSRGSTGQVVKIPHHVDQAISRQEPLAASKKQAVAGAVKAWIKAIRLMGFINPVGTTYQEWKEAFLPLLVKKTYEVRVGSREYNFMRAAAHHFNFVTTKLRLHFQNTINYVYTKQDYDSVNFQTAWPTILTDPHHDTVV